MGWYGLLNRIAQRQDDKNTFPVDGSVNIQVGDAPVDESNPVPVNGNVQLTGSIAEYGWVDGDTEPTPEGFAFGVKVNPATGAITTMYWNGSAWAEVV